MQKKFNPKPGDKIICNNGEEFICCTKEFIRTNIYEGIQSSLPILGYNTKDGWWLDWNADGVTDYNSLYYNIREVIPAESKEVVKEEETRYSLQEIELAYNNSEDWQSFEDELKKIFDLQYKEYLRLKAIYE